MLKKINNTPAMFDITGLWRVRSLEFNTIEGWKPLMEYGYDLLWEMEENGTMTEYYVGGEKNRMHYIWESIGCELIIEHPDNGYASLDQLTPEHVAKTGYQVGIKAGGVDRMGDCQVLSGLANNVNYTGLSLNMEDFIDVPVGDTYSVELMNSNIMMIYDQNNKVAGSEGNTLRYIVERLGNN